MDKRFKWPLKQRANYSESPYHHNPSRGHQRHLHGHPNQTQHLHQHPGKSYVRQQYGYGRGGHGGGNNNYRKPLPPPPPPLAELGGGAMAPPSSGGTVGAGADMVTLIVENNNLKRMIVLHLKLMQEQTDSLAAKDKDLDDQSAKMSVVMAQNMELKQAVAKLEAANEDLRKQLRRKNQRRTDNDDDDDDPSLPPAAPQQKLIRCHAETQTVFQEREQSTQTIDAQPQFANALSRAVNMEEIPAVCQHAGVVTNQSASKRSESKGRGEFNGKKVSTFILQRMNQDSEHHIQEQTELAEEHVLLAHKEQHSQEEDQLGAEEDHLQMQVVHTEEVVGGDIFHDALESIEMEVVTEELVDLEEHAHSVDANGHMDEDENEDEEDEDNSDKDDESEEDDDEEDDDQSLDSNTEVHSRTEEELWQNQINSMELDPTEEKACAPSAHSTPNHQQKSSTQAEIRKEGNQNRITEKWLQLEPEQTVKKHLDPEAGENEDVTTVKIAEEKRRQETVEIAGHALKTLIFLQEVALKKKEKEHESVPEPLEVPTPQKHQEDATDDHKAIRKQLDVPRLDPKPKDPPREEQKMNEDGPLDVREEQQEDVNKMQKETVKKQPQDAPKHLPKAIAPKVASVPNTSSRETTLPKANTADIKDAPAQKMISNHQSTKTQTEPIKTQRLQVKIRQYEMHSDIRTGSTAPADVRKHNNVDQVPAPELKSNTSMLVNDKKTTSETSRNLDEEMDDVETVKRKLAEHLKKELLSQSHQSQVTLKKIRERVATNLIYPPPSAPVSSTTITPAPTPSTTPTPGSTPQHAVTSSIDQDISAAKSKSKAAEQIATPLTPQSNSSVSSTTSTTRKTVNNCSPHTYSKATARSGKLQSRFRTATFPYSTRTWEDQEFHCDNEFFLEEADELLADNPSLEIPKWRDVPVPPSSDKTNTEPLNDATFERRHQKYVKDEVDRKCRDARYMKEQIRLEQLRMRRNQDEVLVALDPLRASTFYPLPEDIEAIQFVNEVTVQAFGENVVNMEARDDFGVPWVDAVEAPTSIARSKALAEPVATLASKKLPTTAAEARHQENHSSYVFPKRRKRQKNR
ncbi:protein male-specific lethal-1 [Drosophila santomea]|uniref:protein male-specific lethal-1 n=1 Tax=Drosophila santomea TaxID=129105 RepID=UPI001954A47C|nr:protein male-specific lethal-1 [Drosophila santomea]